MNEEREKIEKLAAEWHRRAKLTQSTDALQAQTIKRVTEQHADELAQLLSELDAPAAPSEIRVPSIWRIERCNKHPDYESDCLACGEEILTIKTENAYRAGFAAALKSSAASAASACTCADSNNEYGCLILIPFLIAVTGLFYFLFSPWRIFISACFGIITMWWGWHNLRANQRLFWSTCSLIFGIVLWGFAVYKFLEWRS